MTPWNSRFVEKYIELQKLGETDEEKLFVETGKALLAEGVILRRVGEARAVSILLNSILFIRICCLFVRGERKAWFFFPQPWLMFLNSRSNSLRWNILEFCGSDLRLGASGLSLGLLKLCFSGDS